MKAKTHHRNAISALFILSFVLILPLSFADTEAATSTSAPSTTARTEATVVETLTDNGQFTLTEKLSNGLFRTTLNLSCGQMIKFHEFDPRDGEAEIAKLEHMNDLLEAQLKKGKLTLDVWKELGLVSEHAADHVMMRYKRKLQPGESLDRQYTTSQEPFKQIDFPLAQTGIYLTKRALVNWQNSGFHATMLALPGMGFFGSSAMSMAKVANAFATGTDESLPIMQSIPRINTKHPEKSWTEHKRLRVIMIPVDTSLNGMQANAPIAFASPRGVRAVIRHIDLYVRTRFPGLPRFMIGRSQGGIDVLENSLHIPDVGHIALNPSHSAPDVMAFSVNEYEGTEPYIPRTSPAYSYVYPDDRDHDSSRPVHRGLSGMKDSVWKAWMAHFIYTERFQALASPARGVGRSLTIVSDRDESYPQPDYRQRIAIWAELQSDLRKVETVYIPDEEMKGAHTLLIGECPKTRHTTLGIIGNYIVDNMGYLKQLQDEMYPIAP